MRRRFRPAPLLVAALLAATAGCDRGAESREAPPLGGRLLDEQGAGVPSAEVCWIEGESLVACVRSAHDGRFELPGPPRERFRVVADGFHARQLGVNALDAPVVLSRAPVLVARLVDAVTGEPIAEGQVRVTLPSGREFGPFPVNRSGVRVRRVLPVGDVLVRAAAPGHRPADPVPLRLEAGRETTVEIPLAPDD